MPKPPESPATARPEPASPVDRITRLQLVSAIALLAGSIGWLLYAAFASPDVAFLTGGPQWIMVDTPLDSNAIHVDLNRVPEVRFEKRFTLDEPAPAAELRARAIALAEFVVNGRSLHADAPDESWRRTRTIPLGDALTIGENTLEVRVRNARGPALLQLEVLDGVGGSLLETDASWRALASARGRAGLVRVKTTNAVDTRPHPQSAGMPSSGALLVRHAGVLGLLFALSALLSLALSRSLSEPARGRAPQWVLGAATVFWLAVYTLKSTGLPVVMGFDIVGHLQYIDFLLEKRALPLATDGWSTYHPPLGHLVTAAIAAAPGLARESVAAQWLYRLPMFLAGLGNVFAVYFVGRRLFPGDPLRQSLATGFAALLPMNLYMSAYVSNEPLHSFLVSLCLLLAVGLLVGERSPARRVAGLAAALGLAIATKFTALVAVPLAAGFLGAKVWLVDRAPLGRAVAVGGALLFGAGLVGGWPYVRNWVLLGRPVVGNWDLPGNRVWWEQPGFHTFDYYASFGESLRRPFFAGYHSFWDGLYSTFWADGLVAGMIRLATRHDAWNYDFVTLGSWLAFPATVALALGFGRALRFCLRGDDLRRRVAMSLLVTFLYALSFALLSITLRLPYYAQAKAFYVLSAIVPLSVVAALGLAWVPERLTAPRWIAVRLLYWGWLGTLAGALGLSFLG